VFIFRPIMLVPFEYVQIEHVNLLSKKADKVPASFAIHGIFVLILLLKP
jgi:hypothetical protein